MYSSLLSISLCRVLTQNVQVTCRYILFTASKLVRARLRVKCDGTRAETIFRLSAKRTSPFKSAGASVQSTTGSRGVRISGCNAGYTMFRGSMTGTGYLLNSPVSPSLPVPCVTACHHISTGLFNISQCGVFHVMVQVHIFYLDTKKLFFPLKVVAESILCAFHKSYIFTE